MNIVQSGTIYRVYDDGIATFDTLPTGVYDVCCNPMTGFYLVKRSDLQVKEDKIYGNSPVKVNKILKSYEMSNRNFGVILSGPKGVGKTLFARILSQKANEIGLPVLIVDSYIPGIANFLSGIQQEILVLFDEFEKTFGAKEDRDPQEEFLSLFDGVDNGKKLFIITCNKESDLNEYFLNRPGRFHYHFRMDAPTPEEIRDYLTDKLDPQYYFNIDKIVGFSCLGKITYDCLRAIAFELNNGFSLAETMNDLNMTRSTDMYSIIELELNDGRIFSSSFYFSFNEDYCSRWVSCFDSGVNEQVKVSFAVNALSVVNNQLVVDSQFVNVSRYKRDADEMETFPPTLVKEVRILPIADRHAYGYDEKLLSNDDKSKTNQKGMANMKMNIPDDWEF